MDTKYVLTPSIHTHAKINKYAKLKCHKFYISPFYAVLIINLLPTVHIHTVNFNLCRQKYSNNSFPKNIKKNSRTCHHHRIEKGYTFQCLTKVFCLYIIRQKWLTLLAATFNFVSFYLFGFLVCNCEQIFFLFCVSGFCLYKRRELEANIFYNLNPLISFCLRHYFR